MGAEVNGLVAQVQGLAKRLEALERENTELRKAVVALRASDTGRNGPARARSLVPRREEKQTPRFEGPVSRQGQQQSPP